MLAARQMLVEEAQHLAQHRQFGLDPRAPWRGVDPRAVVPRSQHDAALGIGQRQEARQRAVGVAGAVHPAGDGIDRDVLRDLVEVVVGAERGAAEGGIVGQRVVAEFELGDEVGHAEVREVPLHRLRCERAVLVVVDRHRPLQGGIGEVVELRPEVAAVVVERQHQLVVDQRQPLDQHAAGIIVVGPGVPHREQGRDRLDRLVAGAGEEIAGRAEIGDAGGADASVAPRLGDDPVGDRLVVGALARAAEGIARAEAGAGAARIDHHHGIAARHEHVAVLVAVGRRLDVAAGRELEAANIGRQDQHCRPAPRGIAVRQDDVDGEPAAVGHGHVDRGGRTHPVLGRTTGEIAAGRHLPGRA